MSWFFTNRIVQKRHWCSEVARKAAERAASVAAAAAAAAAAISEIPTLTGGCDANSCGATTGSTVAPSHRNSEHEGDTSFNWPLGTAPGVGAFLTDDFHF
jgi:hypothetical protein